MAAMKKQELADLVSQLVRDCETYRDALSIDRVRAMEYYDGVMKDVPSDANRSKVVSRDVRAAVKKVLPSLVRTVLGNDKVVQYEPVNQGDEAGAEQATDYINYIVFPESYGYDAVQDAAHDALKLRNGVIRWWYEKKQTVEVSSHARRRDVFGDGESTATALQEVEYYELYVKVDADDDGIAELRRLVFAGGIGPDNLLEDEEWDEVPFADLITERRPHQREGNSVTDDMAEIQRVKTVLLRQTLDNLYWQNNQQPIVQEGVIQNPESVLNPKFGQPIRVGQGVDVRGAVGYTAVPFVARESFSMLGYLDQEATDRTGISDASSGMAPDALQNMTAKATALVEQAGIGQTELMVRTFAQGLKRVFKGLLGLVIRHQDRPRAVRLRGQWVTFDPRHWNAGMDATVNTGLGAGTRERDMLMIQMIQQLQEKLLMTLGPDNPYVSPDNLYNGIAKTVEAAGLKSPDLYFTKPTPEDIQKRMQATEQQPPDAGIQGRRQRRSALRAKAWRR
ncbi:portal protein [Ensifer canadensis]